MKLGCDMPEKSKDAAQQLKKIDILDRDLSSG